MVLNKAVLKDEGGRMKGRRTWEEDREKGEGKGGEEEREGRPRERGRGGGEGGAEERGGEEERRGEERRRGKGVVLNKAVLNSRPNPIKTKNVEYNISTHPTNNGSSCNSSFSVKGG